MNMKVPSDYKLQILGVVLESLMPSLAAASDGAEVSADDVLGVFALGIAAVLDNDTNLRTPRDLRLGAETAAKLIERRAKEFRAMQEQAGMSWLSYTMMKAEAGDVLAMPQRRRRLRPLCLGLVGSCR